MDKTGETLGYSPERCRKIILATMVLHDMCINQGLPITEILVDDESIHEDPLELSENG